ncbi:MAG: hypothetical protein QOI03_896 [Solirubrobacteraceae bacterium]|nr:hypothetical protein [Solirubrobacteraceae bacterium]
MPSVAIGAGGEVVIVWSEGSEEEPDTSTAVEPGEIIQAVSGSAVTGRFGPSSALSPATDFAHAPHAALDGRGDAVVVWETSVRTTTVFEGQAVQAAWRPSGGGWHQPITLARAIEGLSHPQVAIDAEGRAVAVWERGPNDARSESAPASAVESAFGNASAASWGAAQALSSPGESASDVDLASAPTGRIFAAWERKSRTSNAVVAVGGSTASGTWESEATVAVWGHIAPAIRTCPRGACRFVRQLPVAAPRLAMNTHGDAALVWEQAGAYRPFIRAARRSTSGREWLEPVRVSAPGASEAGVALDGSDDAFVIWRAVGTQVATALETAELPNARPCAPARCGASADATS